jgi:hypothetical protein
MLVWMPLPCRDVRQSAIGTAKKFGRPYLACHACKYPHLAGRFKPFSPPPLTTYYPDFIKSVSPSQSTEGAMAEIGDAWLLVPAEHHAVGHCALPSLAGTFCQPDRSEERLNSPVRPQKYEHDPKKWEPVFRKDHAQTIN